MTTITELRERISALRLDPTDDTDANHALLGALLEVAEAAKKVSKEVDAVHGDEAMASLDHALAKLEAAK